MKVVRIGTHTVRDVSGMEASAWVREPIKKVKTYDAPQMSSGLNIAQVGDGTMTKEGLFYMTNNANTPEHNHIVFFTSSCSSMAHGLSVVEGEGWRRAIALLCARDLCVSHWIIHKDGYSLPCTYRKVMK